MTQPIQSTASRSSIHAKRGGQARNRRLAVGDKHQRITSHAATGRATEVSMNNVTMGFSLISVPPFSLRPRGARGALHAAESEPGIATDPMSRAGGEP